MGACKQICSVWLTAMTVLIGAGFTPRHLQAAPRLRAAPPQDDLKRGVAILREDSALYSKPNEQSEEVDQETLEIGKRYFVLGLSIDGLWAQILTRKNTQGWVMVHKLNRLPESDQVMRDDFIKLVDRYHWQTNRLVFNAGLYPHLDGIGEVGLTVLPKGFSGLKGESFDLILGGIWIKKTAQVDSHFGYRGLLQWAFRSAPEGNLHIGPRIGYESRKGYDPLSLVSVRKQHHGVLGVLFRYMPNPLIGFSIVPEFLVHLSSPNRARLQAMAAITIML